VHCTRELPSVDALYVERKDRGFTLLLVNLGENAEIVRRAVKARGYRAAVLLDVDRTVAAAYGVTATPTVYLIDRRSRVIGRAIGRRDWTEEVGRRLIDALLSRP